MSDAKAFEEMSGRQQRHLIDDVMERRRDQLGDDLASVMNSPVGRRVLRAVIYDLAGLDESSWNGAIKDGRCGDNHTNYNEGRRSVGLRLLRRLNEVVPERVLVMSDEHTASVRQDLAFAVTKPKERSE